MILAIVISQFAKAAEEEFLLLIRDSYLIQKIDKLDPAMKSRQVINRYYEFLDNEELQYLEKHRAQLSTLLPAYEVALTAADSAELSEILDKITLHWASISQAHEKLYAVAAAEVLTHHYAKIYSFINTQ